MKRNYKMIAAVFAAGMVAVSANAQYAPEDSQRDTTGVYVRGGVESAWYRSRVKVKRGGTQPGDRLHNAYGGYLGVGYAFTPMFRLEWENSLLDASEGMGSDAQTFWYLCKGLAYLDIPLGDCPLTPYALLGGGYANARTSGKKGVKSTSHGGGTLDCGLGFNCAVTDDLSVDVSYRFIYTRWKPVRVGGTTVETTSLGALASLGLRYIF